MTQLVTASGALAMTDTSGRSDKVPDAIDCHAHYLPEQYVQELQRLAAKDPILAGASQALQRNRERQSVAYGDHLYGDISLRLDLMARAGIAVQVISPGSSLAFAMGAGHRVDLVRLWNDAVDEATGSFHSSLRQFGALPLPDVDASLAEIKRIADRKGMVGFSINSHVLGSPIDDERWLPLYALFNELGSTVFIHPDGFCVPGLMDRTMEVDVGTQLDDTIAAVRLYSAGILTNFPDVRWIVAHLGGALPFIMGRLDEHWERDREWRTLPDYPSRSLTGLFVDTAGHSAQSVRFAAEILGADRLVLGSDFPAVNVDNLSAAVQKVELACDSGSQKKILFENARTLLRM